MAKSSKRLFSTFRMFANGALSLVAVLMFAVPSYAEIVEFFTDFTAGSKPATSYQQKDQKESLAPYFPNFAFYESSGDSNLRYGADEDGFITLAAGSGQRASFQITASSLLSSATCFDLTAGDLVYEAYYSCGWSGVAASSNQHGIAINNNTMKLIFHPGYSNGTTIDGAFRIEGSFGSCNNQNMGFIPARGAGQYTKIKLTIHRDEANNNYVFTTQFAPAEAEYSDYAAYAYTHTCPISTIDNAGGIKSIGPFAYQNNNNCVTNLRLQAPFADGSIGGANASTISEARDGIITSDKPVHWYKFDDPTTTTITDYGSSPIDGTATNVNMSTISELNQVASFSGSGSKVTVLDSAPINGPWTAEFFLNSAQMDSWQSLAQSGSYSLRWSQYGHLGTPGFTVSGVKDYIFTNPEGGDFDYEIPINEWLHVTYVNDGESMLLYIDGELVGKNTERLIPLPYTTIGANGNSGYFQGMIDYVALYNRVLSADEIYDHAHPIPEPATWALLILGAAGMLYWRKKN